MKKKILFVITKSNFGGAQRYVYDLATSLPTDLFEVVVVLGGEGILKDKLTEKNIRTISLSYLQRDINLKNEFLSFKEFFQIFREEKPDIVHGNSSKAGGISAFIARILFVPKIIFTAHAWAFNENRSLISRFIISFFHWLNIILSDQTIAVSQAVKDQVEHFPFIKNKINVIHLGIEPPFFLSTDEARAELGIKNTGIIMGTIAELHPVKGLPYAIDSLSYFRDKNPDLFNKIYYYILGQGDEMERLNNHIIKRKLEDKVFLLGWKSNAAKYLKAFDLFILPSLSEAFGYVLLEAGYAKVPVLASEVGGIPEIIEDNVTGKLFPSKEAKAIQLTIEQMIEKPKQNKAFSEALYKKINSEFSLENMISKTIEIYNDPIELPETHS